MAGSGVVGYNPLTYRGYVYDFGTGLYYLQSRYYDPETGRFINADAFASTGQGLTGNNMFAYCGNNPVNRSDPTGCFFEDLWEWLKETAQGAYEYIQSYSYAYAGLGTFTQVDGALPFADIASLAIGGTLTIGIVTYAAYEAYEEYVSKTKAEEKTISLPPIDSQTPIYRYYSTKTENLAPRKGKDYDGLSFSTLPPKTGVSTVMTTIEIVNATGFLKAVQTSPHHVLIVPTNGTVVQWMNQGMASSWSFVLSHIVIEWDGDN